MKFRKRSSYMNNVQLIVGVLLVAVIVAANIFTSLHTESFEGIVTDKEIVYKTGSDNKITRQYRVTIQDTADRTVEVYQISESLLHGSFSTATLYAQLNIGQKYQFKVSGYRSGFFSMFQNIVAIDTANSDIHNRADTAEIS